MAIAMQWVSHITTIAFEMVLPIVVGYWIDQRLGTKIVFTILGLFLGFSSGMWHLIKLAKTGIKP
jgi:F0F1-type ATP synthase assembly protein I